MSDRIITLEVRQDKVEDAIARLTDISSDLNKMLAVHEQRITQQEKHIDSIDVVLEKRREESDLKLKDVYETIRSEDKNILIEINKLRSESSDQHTKLTTKIGEMEKTIWTYMGGFSVITFLLMYGGNILKFFGK